MRARSYIEVGFEISERYSTASPKRGTFAAELRRLRRKAKMSQMRLARMAGLSNSYICRLEHANRRPEAATIIAIARVLDCEDVDRDRMLVLAGHMPLDRYLCGMVYDYLNMPAAISEGTCGASTTAS